MNQNDPSNSDSRDELEQLEVIEANTLSVGTSFHAFRFQSIDIQELSAVSVEKLARAVNQLVQSQGITEVEAVAELEKSAEIEKRIVEAAEEIVKKKLK